MRKFFKGLFQRLFSSRKIAVGTITNSVAKADNAKLPEPARQKVSITKPED